MLVDSNISGDVKPKLKLTYFAIKALGEPIRFLLQYGGIEFEDFRIKQEEWCCFKPDMPFGQVPVIEINGKKVNQSVAICRYLAKQVKLTGANDLEDLEIDAMADTINDLRGKIALYHYETDPQVKKTLKMSLHSETLPFYLERLEEIAKINNGHLALGKLTWVDMYFAGLLDYFNFMLEKNAIANYPNLREVEVNVLAIPSIQLWTEQRPKTDL